MFKNLPFKTVFIYTAAIISVISVLIYSVSIDGPFVFDDYQDIKQNPDIRLDSLSINKFYQAAFDSPARRKPEFRIKLLSWWSERQGISLV